MTIFNRIIVFVDASLLVLAVSCWINIYQVEKQAIEASFSYYVSKVSLAVIGTCLCALFCYLFVKIDQLNTETVKERVGATYNGFKA